MKEFIWWEESQLQRSSIRLRMKTRISLSLSWARKSKAMKIESSWPLGSQNMECLKTMIIFGTNSPCFLIEKQQLASQCTNGYWDFSFKNLTKMASINRLSMEEKHLINMKKSCLREDPSSFMSDTIGKYKETSTEWSSNLKRTRPLKMQWLSNKYLMGLTSKSVSLTLEWIGNASMTSASKNLRISRSSVKNYKLLKKAPQTKQLSFINASRISDSQSSSKQETNGIVLHANNIN